MMASTVAAVAIGRNEGARMIACLDALVPRVDRVIYVDSGSTDGSVAAARARGAEVLALDMNSPFTAARARNAGLARLTDAGAPPPDYIQFIDADCVLDPDWIDTARDFLDETPQVAAACGRRRERFPEASIWNAMIDAEWDTPPGPTQACGGDVLMRTAPLLAVGGFDPSLIAGEEPELCLRLRRAGWEIWRLDAEMTLHDAALTHVGQWWQRTKRAGYTYAEGAAMHGAPPERHKVAQLRRAVAWGLALPLFTILGTLLTPWALLLLLAWPAQMLRLRARGLPWSRAIFLTLGKLPEAQGVLTYAWHRISRTRARLIEYK